jgi:hypothetical protein
MIDLSEVAATVVGIAVSSGIGWIVLVTRLGKDTETVRTNLSDVKESHAKRLDGHDADILDIRENYLSRREFDAQMAASMAAINANYANIKDQLTVHGRWLEFAVFNKKPEQPGINGS